MIWLVDMTSYAKSIDPQLEAYKKDYFRMKSYARYQKIGPTAPVKTKVYGTGLLRLATLLHRNGCPVRYLDRQLLEKALGAGEELPQLVAFSCVCPTIPAAAKLCRQIKAMSASTEVVLGGIHVNVATEQTRQKFPEFDRLIVGFELEAAQQLTAVPLQDLPGDYVDYSLLPYPIGEYAINTFSTMGCPFRCRYCVDSVAPHFCASDTGQLEELMHHLPEGNLVHFFDSVLGHSQQRLRQVCAAIKATGHRFKLSCDMRADLMTPELAKVMEDAGFVELRLGMESADDSLLEQNERTLSFAKFREKLAMIRENSHFYIALYTVVGLPGTTWQSQEKTWQACHELLTQGLVDEIKSAMYVPYPMAHLDYSQQGVTVCNEDWSQYDRQSYPVYHTRELTREELWQIYLETSRRINESWLEALGFDRIDDVPQIRGYYSEYVAQNYLQNP